MMDDDFSSLLLRKRKREKIEQRSLFRVFNPIVFETKEERSLSLAHFFTSMSSL